MEKKWYSTVTNKGSAHEQGLVIDENTGETIAVTFKPENAVLVASAPELLAMLEHEANYMEQFALYGTATAEVRIGHLKRAGDIRDFISNHIQNA